MKLLFSFLFAFYSTLTVVYPQAYKCIAQYLQCEYLENPLGVDVASPRLSWLINDTRYGAVQKGYRLLIGTDSLSVVYGKSNVWDSERVESDRMLVVYDGPALHPFTRYFWSVQVWDMEGISTTSLVSSFETGMMKTGNWKGSWISDEQGIDKKEAPYFRKDINITHNIQSARAYIAVAGLYELSINGKKVGDHRLDPMYTRFDRRNLYVTYNITDFIKSGQNAVGVLLGNGWYNHQSTAVWFFDRAPWRNRPAFCMDIRITYDDGSTETITTDSSWKTALSPVILNSIYTAEHYDARLELPGLGRARL